MKKTALALLALLVSSASLAATPWQKITHPVPGSAQSIGGFSNGCIVGADTLPVQSEHYQVMRTDQRRYFGHPDLVMFIQRLSTQVSNLGFGTVLIGDMGMPAGGRFNGGHASHQTVSGCGVYDGAEIHEAVLTLLAIARSGAQAICFAPDKQQADVINHLTGEAMAETRNVLIEAARITRGEIRPLAQAVSSDLDALIVPGGFGAAKNLSNFASQGSECRVDSDLEIGRAHV